ncbi:MAG: hypothetical protein HYY22_07780 [Thaumarchaeota archaeon]|nr:hypothetical protein [Nitrososphaerota archaeon]
MFRGITDLPEPPDKLHRAQDLAYLHGLRDALQHLDDMLMRMSDDEVQLTQGQIQSMLDTAYHDLDEYIQIEESRTFPISLIARPFEEMSRKANRVTEPSIKQDAESCEAVQPVTLTGKHAERFNSTIESVQKEYGIKSPDDAVSKILDLAAQRTKQPIDA